MTTDYASLGHRFVAAFNTKDASRLAPFLHPDVVFPARLGRCVQELRTGRVRDEFDDDRIISWRDYGNPEYARKLLTA